MEGVVLSKHHVFVANICFVNRKGFDQCNLMQSQGLLVYQLTIHSWLVFCFSMAFQFSFILALKAGPSERQRLHIKGFDPVAFQYGRNFEKSGSIRFCLGVSEAVGSHRGLCLASMCWWSCILARRSSFGFWCCRDFQHSGVPYCPCCTCGWVEIILGIYERGRATCLEFPNCILCRPGDFSGCCEALPKKTKKTFLVKTIERTLGKNALLISQAHSCMLTA